MPGGLLEIDNVGSGVVGETGCGVFVDVGPPPGGTPLGRGGCERRQQAGRLNRDQEARVDEVVIEDAAGRRVVGEMCPGVAVVGQQSGVIGMGLEHRPCDVGLVGPAVRPLVQERLSERLVEQADAGAVAAHLLQQVVRGAPADAQGSVES